MLRRALGQRRAGILLHPTSLPGAGGHGRLGAEAHRFVDWLAEAGFSVWQTLPLNPRDRHGSAYAADSVFAGDPTLIDGATLAATGVIGADEAREIDDDPAALPPLIDRVVTRLESGRHPALADAVEAFAARERNWLDDFALFRVLRDTHDAPWYEWPAALRDRDGDALASVRRRHAGMIRAQVVAQYVVDRQWGALRTAASQRGIALFGDLSFFVAHDSADVWANRHRFRLDDAGALVVETGVPPDYFAADGQLWHMPHYDWEALRAEKYDWWIRRLQRQAEWFDVVRIDHFRGLAAAWEVPAGATTALHGHWVPGPGLDLLRTVNEQVPDLVLAAEDLGLITDDVNQLRDAAGLPGMCVLQFGFDGDPANPHLPDNVGANTIYYTGTHDNQTFNGWFGALDDHTCSLVRTQLQASAGETPCEAAKHRVLESSAILAVLPMQDVLCLDDAARMNTPGTSAGNWAWRLDALPGADVVHWHRDANRRAGRIPEAVTKAGDAAA